MQHQSNYDRIVKTIDTLDYFKQLSLFNHINVFQGTTRKPDRVPVSRIILGLAAFRSKQKSGVICLLKKENKDELA
jgi:hypothetical protein